MTQILNKWLRRIHRWLALPFIALVLIILFTRGTAAGDIAQRVQGPLLIIMAITGAYLWLLPYLTKWRRDRRRAG